MEEHGHSTGGRLCLELINTVSARDTNTPTDRLDSYADLLALGERQGALSAASAAQLAEIARSSPELADGVLHAAVELREALYRIFIARTGGNLPAADDLQ